MIAIIKYNAGNITSVQNAIQRLGFECVITDNPSEIIQAEKVIFPGVGEASSAIKYLKDRQLDLVIKNLKQPVLGICLGQQLMCDFSEEGNTIGMKIFNAKVKKFPDLDIVPHMGWNNLSDTKSSILDGILPDDDVYFVHSYYAEICDATTSVCQYILPFSASMQKDNFYATQFHPEKSADVGERILLNFLNLKK